MKAYRGSGIGHPLVLIGLTTPIGIVTLILVIMKLMDDDWLPWLWILSPMWLFMGLSAVALAILVLKHYAQGE